MVSHWWDSPRAAAVHPVGQGFYTFSCRRGFVWPPLYRGLSHSPRPIYPALCALWRLLDTFKSRVQLWLIWADGVGIVGPVGTRARGCMRGLSQPPRTIEMNMYWTTVVHFYGLSFSLSARRRRIFVPPQSVNGE